MAGTQGGSSSSEPTVEERLEGLKLVGEEGEELDLSGELDELVKEVRWLALMRVHTSKTFSHAALFNHMRNAWSAAKEILFKVKGDDLFLVQFNCLGDWSKVMEGGPWIFRGAPVMLAKYDGFSNIYEHPLKMIPAWVRIMGLPEGLMKKKVLAEKVAAKVGEESILVMVTEGKLNPTAYLRSRVQLNLDKPLVRFVPIILKEAKKYLVQYERLPQFYAFCGLLGHEVRKCGDGVHEPETCEWGDWLLVKFPVTAGRSPMGCGSGRDGREFSRGRGRGCGFGRGDQEDVLEYPYESENEDTTANVRMMVTHIEGKFDSPEKVQDKRD